MEKRKKILKGIGAVVALLLCYFLFEHFMYVSTDDAYVEAHATLLAPKVAGYINKVNITDGQRVKKDEVLVEIDARDYENALVQAKGELAALEARRRDADRAFQRIADLFLGLLSGDRDARQLAGERVSRRSSLPLELVGQRLELGVDLLAADRRTPWICKTLVYRQGEAETLALPLLRA